jgi:hypothetical protein
MTSYKCPVCGTSLSKERWERALGIWKAREEHVHRREEDLRLRESELTRKRGEIRREGLQEGKRREKRRADYLASQLAGVLRRDREKDKRIKELEQQLKRGTTPQVEGLLYEEQLAKQLRRSFPHDEVRRAGKGGDVILGVRANGQVVGTVVFECKRVQGIPRPHVEQTHRAIVQREADFGVLVTSGTRPRFGGFAAERDVLIVNPAGVLFLTQMLRGWLIEIAKLKLERAEREKAAREIFKYLESPRFRNQMRDLVDRARNLARMLNDEVEKHARTWERRYEHYKTIFDESFSIGSSLSGILESQLGGRGAAGALPATAGFPELARLPQ